MSHTVVIAIVKEPTNVESQVKQIMAQIDIPR
jgi:hypothetical protein